MPSPDERGGTRTVDHAALAARLRAAYTNGPVPPLRDGLGALDATGAYAVQGLNVAHWRGEGRRVIGYKIGLTAPAIQQHFGVEEPDFGVLFDDMRVADGGLLAANRLIQPRVEVEIAFVMGRDIAGVEGLADAVDYAIPALEIVDSRIADWAIGFADTVADNGSAAFFVLGERKPLVGLDLYSCGMVLELDGKVTTTGAGAAAMGHPLNALAWLARSLTARGEILRAGDVVLTGALGPMIPLAAGTAVRAHIGGLGSVSLDLG